MVDIAKEIKEMEEEIKFIKNIMPEKLSDVLYHLKNDNIYAVEMSNGQVWGVPAEIIADNYATYYKSRGEDYEKSFNTMMHWFEIEYYDFEYWAKNNMNWSDVKDKAFFLFAKDNSSDFENEWANGEALYLQKEIIHVE